MTRTITQTTNKAAPTAIRPSNTGHAVDAIDYEANARQRRRAVVVLAWSTVVFFAGAIAVSYAVALAHGYGTGFGDGREITSRVIPLHGTGFWGDLGLLALTFAMDAAMLTVWYFAASRLDNLTADDPVAPDDPDVDLNDAASWYVVNVPRLTRSLYVVAIVCLLGIVTGAAVLLPVVTLRYGFVL